MAVLVSDNVIKNAKKCMNCAFSKLKDGIDKNSVLVEEANIAVDALFKISCKMCPNGADFKKVHGVTPYEYFTGNKPKKY